MIVKPFHLGRGFGPCKRAFWSFLSVLLFVGSLSACGSQVIIGSNRSDSINLTSPVWMVAERSDEPGGYVPGDPFGVYLIAKDGELRRVTDYLDRDPAASWSPDGEAVAFWVETTPEQEGFQYHLRIANSDGTNINSLTPKIYNTRSSPFPVKWSPSGERLAFLTGGSEREHLYVIDKDGSNLKDLRKIGPVDSNDYSWSPDGERIAVQSTYEGRSSLYLVQFVPEPEIIHLAPDWSTRPTTIWSPAWSPDGSRIAYFSAAGVAVMDITTRAVQILTDEYGYVNGPLMWSPDGKWLAFVAESVEGEFFECKDENVYGTLDYVHLLASDGSHFTKLTPVEYSSFDWSPDSEKLAFTLCENIYTISVKNEASPHKLMSVEKGYTGHPEWSPDGGMILFTVALEHIFPDSQMVRTLYTINADGSNQLTLTDRNTNVLEYGWLDK